MQIKFENTVHVSGNVPPVVEIPDHFVSLSYTLTLQNHGKTVFFFFFLLLPSSVQDWGSKDTLLSTNRNTWLLPVNHGYI